MKIISVFFYESTTGAGGGHDNRCYAVTVSLADFMDMDEIGHRLADYRGTVYMKRGYSIDLWLDNKEEFIEKWLGDERSPLHGWYLYEGRIGFFFCITEAVTQISSWSFPASLTDILLWLLVQLRNK